MVHAHAHSPRLQAGQLQERPDATRIAALSGAIAVNVIALLLLLLPMSTPPPAQALDEASPPWILPKDEPQIVPIERFTPPTKPVDTPRRTVITPPQASVASADVPVIVEHGSDATTPPLATTDESTTIEPVGGPIAAVRLEYATAPAPTYPRDALRMGLQGTVLLQVLVDVDGRPLDVQIQTSSGHRQLDDAARKHVLKRWMFRPATRDGRPVQAIGLVPVAFALD